MSISGTGSIKFSAEANGILHHCLRAEAELKDVKSMPPSILVSAPRRLFLVISGRKCLTKGARRVPRSPSHAIQRAGQANELPCCERIRWRLAKRIRCAWELLKPVSGLGDSSAYPADDEHVT